jgi:hypothetical protein
MPTVTVIFDIPAISRFLKDLKCNDKDVDCDPQPLGTPDSSRNSPVFETGSNKGG